MTVDASTERHGPLSLRATNHSARAVSNLRSNGSSKKLRWLCHEAAGRAHQPTYCPAALNVAICITHGPLEVKGAVAL